MPGNSISLKSREDTSSRGVWRRYHWSTGHGKVLLIIEQRCHSHTKGHWNHEPLSWPQDQAAAAGPVFSTKWTLGFLSKPDTVVSIWSPNGYTSCKEKKASYRLCSQSSVCLPLLRLISHIFLQSFFHGVWTFKCTWYLALSHKLLPIQEKTQRELDILEILLSFILFTKDIQLNEICFCEQRHIILILWCSVI